MRKRQRLAKGIFADRYGISVIYFEHGTAVETRFPSGTSVDRLIAWRETQLKHLRESVPHTRNQMARDAVKYLKRLKGRPGYSSERSHLTAWLRAFGPTVRRSITTQRCELILAEWRQQGYASKTLRHRHRVLQSFYRFFDGRTAITPVDDIRKPPKGQPRPVSVSDATIEAVALELRKHEILGTLRDAKTRARFLVLATHSQRPAELQRAKLADVDFERRLWFVRGVKGGFNTIVPLNEDQIAAWQMFMAADAWGIYDSRSFSRTLKRAGWPKHIRPYNLRHSTGFALDARGVDLGDIQRLMGHTSPETTRSFYVPGLIQRLAAATQKLEGRFRGEGFVPRSALPRSSGEDAKGAENRRKLKGGKKHPVMEDRTAKGRK